MDLDLNGYSFVSISVTTVTNNKRIYGFSALQIGCSSRIPYRELLSATTVRGTTGSRSNGMVRELFALRTVQFANS